MIRHVHDDYRTVFEEEPERIYFHLRVAHGVPSPKQVIGGVNKAKAHHIKLHEEGDQHGNPAI